MLLSTHPKQVLPQKNIAFLKIFFFFFFFFSNSLHEPFLKINKSCILIEERLQRLLLYAFLPYIQHL